MIDFKSVRKTYGERDILDDTTFRINRNERVGVVGPNGAGKSTLFSLINKEISPDKGEVCIPSRARVGFLKQQLDFFKAEEPLVAYTSAASGELPAIQAKMHEIEQELAKQIVTDTKELLDELGHLQTTFEHMGGYEMRHRAEAALKGLGFKESDLERPMGSFSGGWQMRACMARTLLGEPDILLLDEPSNYLDTPAVEWLQRRLKSYDGTLLLISHDRFLLNTLTDVTLEVDGGNVNRYPGNYDYYVREREERRRHAEAANKNIERKREVLERNIARFGAKASKASQVQSWVKMLDKMEEVDVPEDLHFRGAIRIPEPPHSGVETIRIEGVGHSYDGSKWILKGVSLRLERGDKIGIVGYNGMGKTTLLRILAGRFPPTEGERVLGHKVVVGYQAQEFAELLPPDQTAMDVVKDSVSGSIPAQRIRQILGAFGFSGDSAMKPCKVLSGGEKIRLCFAKIFVNPPNFLVLDEPTTHLDIAAREALQQAVIDYTGTVCVVSHDIEFIRKVSTNIVEMRPPEIVRHFGNYEYYRDRVAEQAKEESAAAKSAAAKPDADNVSAKDRRRERAQRRMELSKEKKRLEAEIERLEKLIEKSEEEKAAIFAELSDPKPNSSFSLLNIRASELEKGIEEATAKWEKAIAEREPLRLEYEKIHE